MKKRVAILISGRGSNMQSLVRAMREPDFPAEPVVVISNRPEALRFAWARDEGLTAVSIERHLLVPATRPMHALVIGQPDEQNRRIGT